MNTIDRKTAALLYAHQFQIYDINSGEAYTINGVFDNEFVATDKEGSHFYMPFNNFIKNYLILCRPYDQLTKEIELGVVPLVELAFQAGLGTDWKPFTAHNFVSKNNEVFSLTKSMSWYLIGADRKKYTVQNQEALFDKLYSFHFRPSQLPETACKYIEV